jgi:hypothetical protein
MSRRAVGLRCRNAAVRRSSRRPDLVGWSFIRVARLRSPGIKGAMEGGQGRPYRARRGEFLFAAAPPVGLALTACATDAAGRRRKDRDEEVEISPGFPAFRQLVGHSAYRELGEQLERKEHELLGEHGFEDTVTEVARLEKTLGIDDLGGFTAL